MSGISIYDAIDKLCLPTPPQTNEVITFPVLIAITVQAVEKTANILISIWRKGLGDVQDVNQVVTPTNSLFCFVTVLTAKQKNS